MKESTDDKIEKKGIYAQQYSWGRMSDNHDYSDGQELPQARTNLFCAPYWIPRAWRTQKLTGYSSQN